MGLRIMVLLLIILSWSVNAQEGSDFKRIPDSQINPQRLSFVSSLTDRILMAQQGGGYYKLTEEEADAAMRNGLNEAVQKQAYAQLKRTFGEYQGLVFDEMLVAKEGTPFEVYRFRGQFGTNGKGVEIRSVLDPEGKLAGFYYKPWKNRL